MLSLFTCPSRSWRQRRDVVLGTVHHTVATRGGEGPIVKLDDASLAHVQATLDGSAHQVVDLGELLREVTDAYEPDTRAIDRLIAGFGDRSVLVLDASAFPYQSVTKVLGQFRIAMFNVAVWPAAIVLVVGEQALDAAINDLASTFYVRPTRRSESEASVYAYRVYRAAGYARLFMWSRAATGRAFTFQQRVERFKRKVFKKDESDFI
jgi:hypothetical protein